MLFFTGKSPTPEVAPIITCDSDAMQVLVHRLSSATSASSLLSNLTNLEQFITVCLTNTNSKVIPGNELIISTLIKLLSHQNSIIQQHALRVLSQVIKANKQYISTCWTLGGLSDVVDLLQSGTLLISYKAIALLGYVAETHSSAVIQAHGVHMLFQWIEKHQELLRNVKFTINTKIVFKVLASLLVYSEDLKQHPDFVTALDINLLLKFLSVKALQKSMAKILLGVAKVNINITRLVLDCFWHNDNQAIRQQLHTQPDRHSFVFLLQARESSLFELLMKRSHAAVSVQEWCKIYNPNDFDLDLQKLLGRGSFANVFQRNLIDDAKTQVVVKQFQPFVGRKDTREYFMKEASIHQYLRHSNIVAFLGIHIEQNLNCIVLEKAEQSLGAIIEKADANNAMPWLQRIKIALEVADALAYVHALDIIHADISSYNVLLMDDGTAKLSDFGLSRLCQSEKSVAGTPSYLAPELRCANKAYCTQESDVYSFAMVLAEISRYKILWSEYDPSLMPWQIVNLFDEETGRPTLGESTPDAFINVICGGWKTRANQRYKITDILSKLSDLYNVYPSSVVLSVADSVSSGPK